MVDGGASDGRTSAASGSLVIPGDFLTDSNDVKAGHGVTVAGGVLFATKLGKVKVDGNTYSVRPTHTSYFPKPGDLIVGYVEGMRSNVWFIDIDAPFNAILPMSLAPTKVEYGGTRDAMDVGTAMLARVQEVDETGSYVLTMKGMGLRKLSSGYIDTIPPHLVEDFDGLGDSVIRRIKDASGCRIMLGANGRIWVDGSPEGISKVGACMKFIRANRDAHDLVDRLGELLGEGE